MGKGGNNAVWKQSVDNAYQTWKYNDLHKNIKTYFNEAGNRNDISKTLKQKVEDASPILSDLSSLHDTIKNEETEGKERLFVRDSSSIITFLGAKIEVPADVADDDEVIVM
jgi:hypothetical protein